MKEISPNSKTILIDMDGVLADFNAKLREKLLQEYPDIDLPETQTEFYLRDQLEEGYRDTVDEIISRKGFFIDLHPIDNCLEAWDDILQHGYLPRICSAPLRKNPWSVEEKIAWLEEYFVPRFGHSVIDLAIIDKRKWLYPGLALIDDRADPNIKNQTKIEPSWRHIVFNQPYNQHSSSPYRILGWDDRLLLNILEELN